MKKQLMKSAYLAMVFFVMFTALLSACKKKESAAPDGSNMSYIVNGTSKSVSGDANIIASVSSDNTLTVSSKLTSTSENITFIIPEFTGKGQFSIPGSLQVFYTNGVIPASNTYTATSGMAEVTGYDNNKITGNFHFYSMNSQDAYKNITDGSFTAKVNKQ